MINTLHNTSIDEKDIRITQPLETEGTSQDKPVEIFEEEYLSPILHNIYVENIFAGALENAECGIKINSPLRG